jgi:hypothetical protein
MEPFIGVEQRNPNGYQRARSLGLLHDGAVLAAEHPEYFSYFRTVDPMSFRVALNAKDGINACLTRLGFDVSHIQEPERKVADEGIRPKLNW